MVDWHAILASETAPRRHVSVVLASGPGPLRGALRLVLGGENDLDVVAEAYDVDGAVRQARRYGEAVIVLDLVLVRGRVVEAIRRLRHASPWTEIVVLSMDEAPVFARHALAGGARAYVLADQADRDLADAVRRAARPRLRGRPPAGAEPAIPGFRAAGKRA
jgi:two-component system, NarL family, response regulator NreC